MGLGKIYTFGPTFRAEHSNTVRHVAEFWHVEPEVTFAELPDIIEIAEDMIKYIINAVLEKFHLHHWYVFLVEKWRLRCVDSHLSVCQNT